MILGGVPGNAAAEPPGTGRVLPYKTRCVWSAAAGTYGLPQVGVKLKDLLHTSDTIPEKMVLLCGSAHKSLWNDPGADLAREGNRVALEFQTG